MSDFEALVLICSSGAKQKSGMCVENGLSRRLYRILFHAVDGTCVIRLNSIIQFEVTKFNFHHGRKLHLIFHMPEHHH